MKKKYLLFIIFQLSITSFGQTKIDEFLTVKFPCNIVKKDTFFSNIRVLTYYCSDKSDSYSLQRILVDSIQDDLNSLPSDLKSLNKFYLGNEKGFTKSMVANGFRLQNSREFKVDKYLGLHVSYFDPRKRSKAIESRFIILNEYLYSLTYINNTNFNEGNKDEFLNSMTIDLTKKPEQMLGNSQEYKRAYIFGQYFFYALLIGGIFFLIKYFKRKK